MEIKLWWHTLLKIENPASEIDPVTGRPRVRIKTETPPRGKELLEKLTAIEERNRPHVKHRPPPQARPRL